MEEDFYATIKFKSGEEIFAKVSCSEEEDRTILLLDNPVTIERVRNKELGFKGSSRYYFHTPREWWTRLLQYTRKP